MNVSLYQTAAALNATSRWQELISENLAASSIPGFKKQDLSFEAVQAGLGATNTGPVMPRVVTATNFRPGELRSTGVSTDLAIEGSGFFEVELPNGARAYTRDGEFHLSAQGQLVTKQGYAVMGDAGPVQLDPRNASPLNIGNDGEISQDGEFMGRIKVVDFNDLRLLKPVSSGYFSADDPNVQIRETAASLRQGYLETANTSSVGEMANLITAMRQFEANQRVLQMQDERMGRVISELSSPI